MFQSTPDLAAGRCPVVRRCCARAGCFNPRPTLQPGDARARRAKAAQAGAFQSTPDLAAGRCARSRFRSHSNRSFNPRPTLQPGDARHGRLSARHRLGFNPRPTLQPGDARARPRARRSGPDVSIHARPCSRAMLHGRTKRRSRGNVSIHARPCSRAMLDLLATQRVAILVSIHARPCSRAMPQALGGSLASSSRFQSTPDLAAGRCWTAPRGRSCSPTCFNPRPTLQPGDARR